MVSSNWLFALIFPSFRLMKGLIMGDEALRVVCVSVTLAAQQIAEHLT